MKRLSSTILFLTSFLGLKKLPTKESSLDLNAEQEEKLKERLGEKDFTKMVKMVNIELKKAEDDHEKEKELNAQLKKAKAEMEETLKSSGYTAEEIQEITGKSEAGDEEATKEINANEELSKLVKSFNAYQKKTDAMIAKLTVAPEPDLPIKLNTNQKMNGVKHSATHLFGEEKSWNAFEGRPWNQRAAGLTNDPTQWAGEEGTVNIQKLNKDVRLFYRENPKAVESLHRDLIDLPSFWPRRLNVEGEVSNASIATDEVTQVRKLNWLPKNKQLIQPETLEIFDVSIDLEWQGHKLSAIERSYLNFMNSEGSSPFKMTFVQFLVTEIMKVARVEDRKSSIKGVYVETPDDATVPGRAINRQNGILHQLYRAIYVDKKVKVPSIGMPTPENIVDYVRKNIETNLDEEIRENTKLVYYLEPDHHRLYIDRKEQLKGIYNTTQSKEEYQTVDHYSNIRLVPLHDLGGTNIHIITFEDNIEILENIPNEKGLLEFQKHLRDIRALGDYKFGCGFRHLGTKVSDDAPEAFKVQTVWTNGVFPFKKDFFIPVFDNKSGELKFNFSNLHVMPGFKTNIEEIDVSKIKPGQILRIKGNTEQVTALVKKNDVFDLASNFDLSTGGTLTLSVQSDYKLKELKRTTEPSITPSEVFTFSEDVIDVTNGLEQSFNGEATTLASIENGIENQILTITNSGEENLTVEAVAGNIQLDSNVVVKPNDKLQLVFVDGEWIEFSKNIAA